MERFAKVFDVESEDTQLLVTHEGYNDEDDRYVVKFACYINDHLVTTAVGFEKPESAEKCFSEFSDATAAKAIATLRVELSKVLLPTSRTKVNFVDDDLSS